MSLILDLHNRSQLLEMAKQSTPCPDCGKKIQGNHYYYKGKRVCSTSAAPSPAVSSAPVSTPTPKTPAAPSPAAPSPTVASNNNYITRWLDEHGIVNYTIQSSDNSVNVSDDVIIHSFNGSKLPIQFNTVDGNFIIVSDELTSCEGFPRTVGQGCVIKCPKLTSLVGIPDVKGVFEITYTPMIKTFEGLPPAPTGIILNDFPALFLGMIHENVKQCRALKCNNLIISPDIDGVNILSLFFVEGLKGIQIHRAYHADDTKNENVKQCLKALHILESYFNGEKKNDVFQCQQELRDANLHKYTEI